VRAYSQVPKVALQRLLQHSRSDRHCTERALHCEYIFCGVHSKVGTHTFVPPPSRNGQHAVCMPLVELAQSVSKLHVTRHTGVLLHVPMAEPSGVTR
jgi:hypothetical protein